MTEERLEGEPGAEIARKSKGLQSERRRREVLIGRETIAVQETQKEIVLRRSETREKMPAKLNLLQRMKDIDQRGERVQEKATVKGRAIGMRRNERGAAIGKETQSKVGKRELLSRRLLRKRLQMFNPHKLTQRDNLRLILSQGSRVIEQELLIP